MQNFTLGIHRPLAYALLASSLALSGHAIADEKKAPAKEVTGKELAFTPAKGNCLACHMMAGGDQPGAIGPPLIAMKARYPDRQALFDVIWDARTKYGPHTIMPPMGAHGILSKDEINKIVDFVHGL